MFISVVAGLSFNPALRMRNASIHAKTHVPGTNLVKFASLFPNIPSEIIASLKFTVCVIDAISGNLVR